MDMKKATVTGGKVRWSIPFVLMVTIIIAYFDRINVSLALPKIAESYGWTTAQTGQYGGMLMSIFYVAYGLANIFISPLAEKFGPRKSLIGLVTIWSIFTALGGAVGLLFVPFIITRFPMGERSRGNAIYQAGIFASAILGPVLMIPLVDIIGWRLMFVTLGIIGVTVSIPLVYYFIYNTPRQHPRITAAETLYIESGYEKDNGVVANTIWAEIQPFIKSGAFWIVVLCGSANNAFIHGIFNWLPTYFTQARGLPFADLWYALSLPMGFSLLGILLWAYLGDKTNKRVIVSCLGPFITAALVFISINMGTTAGTITVFAMASFFAMTYAANEYAIAQHILPGKNVAIGIGVYNGLAMLIGGGLGPVIVGSVVSMTGSFYSGIVALAGVSCFTGVVMLILYRFVKY
jgi:MFS family permease